MKVNENNSQNKEAHIERLQLAMEVAAEGIWDWRLSTGAVFFDPRYYTMAGYAPDEFPADFQEWEKRVHPDDLRMAKAKLGGYLKGETALYQAQFRYLTKDGSWIWIRARGKVVERDKNGKPARMIGTHTDISELKWAEVTRQRSETNKRLVIENTRDCIFVTQGGVVKYANPGTEQLLGYTVKELAGMLFIELIHPGDRQMVENRHKEHLAGLKTAGYYTYKVRTRAGEERLLEINAVQTEWRRAPAVLSFARDITEIRRMEQQLVQTQKMQAIGTLAGGIAHDFNNILSAMMGYTELCQCEAPAGGKLAGRLERVLQAGHRARNLVNQILAFSRQEEIEQKPVQVNLVVKEALKLLRASIPATIEFLENIDPDTGAVMADPNRIHQVIMNLCSNAAHAMQAAGGSLEVCLGNYDIDTGGVPQVHTSLNPGSYVRLTVSDTGYGMDPETVKRIFDPYFTTKKPGEGTGLGLSVIHGIVAGLQGAIKVYSEPGTGSTFQVYIPRIEADPDQAAFRPEITLPRGSETVLLVDDEEFVLEMATELLENLGYKIVPRSSSVEALQAFQAVPDRYDLVVTDQTMPKMTGIDLAAKIREIRSDIPVILTTGFSAGISMQQIGSAHIQALLNKPVLKQELAEAVRGTLDNPMGSLLPEARQPVRV